MIFYSSTAIVQGLFTCLKNHQIRKLAILPWIIGMCCYFTSMVAAYFAHRPILNWLVAPPTGWLDYLIYGGAWLFVSAALLIGTLIISITLTLILSGPFLSAIAEHILSQNGNYIAPQNSIRELARETTRTLVTETVKLLWITPILFIVIAFGFIPILTPVALLLGAWLLAFQFIDIPLDLLKFPARKRFGFCFKHLAPCLVFGITLSVLWAIPFLGIFLSPAATVAASLIVEKIEFTKISL